jgi:hypothetical protein
VKKNLPNTCINYLDPTSVIFYPWSSWNFWVNFSKREHLRIWHIWTLSLSLFQCFFPQNLIANIKTPLFLLNAAYDAWQVTFFFFFFLIYFKKKKKKKSHLIGLMEIKAYKDNNNNKNLNLPTTIITWI